MVKRTRDDSESTTRGEAERPTKKANLSKGKGKAKAIHPANAIIPANSNENSKSVVEGDGGENQNDKRKDKTCQRPTIRHLTPKRPFPSISPAVNASGPKSSHHEGQNLICVTRKTPLGNYMKRCKELLVDGKHTYLLLHALGAAIPHLTLLATSIPLVLPFPREDIKIDVRTETVDCTDEIIPEDEDEDIEYRVKGRSGLSVLIRIGDVGAPSIWENGRVGAMGKKRGKERKRDRKGKKKAETGGVKGGEQGEGEDSATEYGDEDDLGMILDQENDEEGEDTGTFVYREGSQEED